MLILTRRPLETIMIGDEIEVTVLGVKGNHVRIGIKAPKSTPVHREEIYEAIQRGEGPDHTDGPVSEGFAPGFEERCSK